MANALLWADVNEIRRDRGWFVFLGVMLLVVGVLAIATAQITAVTTMAFFGALLLVTGAFQVASAFRHRRHGCFMVHLAGGALDVVIGALLTVRPVAAAAALSLLLAGFFLIGGAFRLLAAITMKLPGHGWAIVGGLIDVALGLMLLSGWPATGLAFIGLAIGIGLLAQGFAWIALGSKLKAA